MVAIFSPKSHALEKANQHLKNPTVFNSSKEMKAEQELSPSASSMTATSMRKIAVKIKLLTVTTSMLFFGGLVPSVNAASSVEQTSQYMDRLPHHRDNFPQHIVDKLIIGTVGITVLGVMVGTGRSIKYQKKSSLEKSFNKYSEKTTSNPNSNGFDRELVALNSNSNSENAKTRN